MKHLIKALKAEPVKESLLEEPGDREDQEGSGECDDICREDWHFGATEADVPWNEAADW